MSNRRWKPSRENLHPTLGSTKKQSQTSQGECQRKKQNAQPERRLGYFERTHTHSEKAQKLSKIETLRLARNYIVALSETLQK
ncbi:hypothetical protein CEXT_478551 [Caerostris extrusa]|uniref:BHLH domain-containing protein n=1 Tax=Caerostris extrusa TaxID=172846 RepID=A0AAV4Y186_CAEEX|nr:hypothetical protein CEXT_478551 [Caerostris extrusa]